MKLNLKVSYFFAVGLLLLFNGQLLAQENENGKSYTIHQDESITNLMAQYRSYNQKRDGVDGYRLQITYTDVREDVYKSKASLYMQFPDLKSYVEYEQPYYKLRLGDFKTRLEATYHLQNVIKVYPGAFIVRDNVKAD